MPATRTCGWVAYMCLFGASELSAGRGVDRHAAEAWAHAAVTDPHHVGGRNGPADASNA